MTVGSRSARSDGWWRVSLLCAAICWAAGPLRAEEDQAAGPSQADQATSPEDLAQFQEFIASMMAGQPSGEAKPEPEAGAPEDRQLAGGFENTLEPPGPVELQLGEIRTIPVGDVQRVAIGNPTIADVEVISADEVLLQAKQVGQTNLIIWESHAQHVVPIHVVDHSAERTQQQLGDLLTALGIEGVTVHHENSKLFLVGQVTDQAIFDRLEHVLEDYPGVINLVAAPPPTPPLPPLPQPLVKLSVQLIEISRKDLEQLGVKWSETATLTEPSVTDQTLHDTLVRWGTSLTRSSVAATLNALVQQNRARVLAEPKLVTASGKEASSFIGSEVPVLTGTTSSTTTATVSTQIEFRNTGVLLKMTPTVLPSGRKITTTIEAEVSSVDESLALTIPVGAQTASVPGFSVRKANTEVTTVSGETVMIAGLLQIEDTNNRSQVPALGSVPFLGRLFRSPEISSTQRELVVAVTPELVDQSAAEMPSPPPPAQPGSSPGRAPEETLDGARESNRTPETASGKTQALDDTLSAAETSIDGQSPVLRYALQIQQRIAASLRYPAYEQPSGLMGQVRLRLHLLRDGLLTQVVLLESSGISSFDQEAVKAARSQSPYPPFPRDLAPEDLWVDVPVLFRP